MGANWKRRLCSGETELLFGADGASVVLVWRLRLEAEKWSFGVEHIVERSISFVTIL